MALLYKLLKTLISNIKTKLSKETCSECGAKLIGDNRIEINNAENMCAECYGRMMLSDDRYETYYMDR